MRLIRGNYYFSLTVPFNTRMDFLDISNILFNSLFRLRVEYKNGTRGKGYLLFCLVFLALPKEFYDRIIIIIVLATVNYLESEKASKS